MEIGNWGGSEAEETWDAGKPGRFSQPWEASRGNRQLCPFRFSCAAQFPGKASAGQRRALQGQQTGLGHHAVELSPSFPNPLPLLRCHDFPPALNAAGERFSKVPPSLAALP